ncbi:sterol 14alpha-demethylase [Geosmithia morbida]|uniref:Sterol 14alpha-demethylase n=1 Tax=Geosmithia morbida TaxID=1094350 RepID=A0A9P4YV95_9HYPO|nr:sterol 14alpha-demethylase [Geosmithia morbida]KAF4122351.1 sterol 14alpha-demethylase [Geosmithia morbida]
MPKRSRDPSTPVFRSDVVYGCPNSKLIEKKKFVQLSLTQRAFEDHVPRIEDDALVTARQALRSEDVREKLNQEFPSLSTTSTWVSSQSTSYCPERLFRATARNTGTHQGTVHYIKIETRDQRRQNKQEAGSDIM